MRRACGSIPLGVFVVLLSACTTGTASAPRSTPTTPPPTSIVSVTTSATIEPTTDLPADPPGPTVIAPQRPRGIDALELDPADLAALEILRPSVQRVLRHDRTAVSEGLALLADDLLIESTGFYGRSSRRTIDLTEGDLSATVELAPEFYATGIAVVELEDEAVGLQFTRLEERVMRFSLDDLAAVGSAPFPEEVNGACSIAAGSLAISTSDGDIQIAAADSLEVTATVTPLVGATRVGPLGDLACVDDRVWGIVAGSSVIARVDPVLGTIDALADLSELTPAGLASSDILSGLAHREVTDTWFTTGKRWDVLYEITLTS